VWVSLRRVNSVTDNRLGGSTPIDLALVSQRAQRRQNHETAINLKMLAQFGAEV
jgi:hypothetical protein